MLWIVVSGVLFISFKKALIASFDEQLKAGALVVAQKTNIQPKIVPLPHGSESFSIVYLRGTIIDTLFHPPDVPFTYPAGNDSISAHMGWRAIRIQQSLEDGGYLEVIFALPSAGIDGRIKKMAILILLVLPAGFILANVLAYWLSLRLLKPVKQVVTLANATNLNNNTELLKEPESDNELKELIVSFNRMLLRIKEQSNRQTAFFASASHELRTPLSIMQTRLQVLMQDTGNAGMQKVYAGQLKDVQQLIKMVNDFLLMSELRSGSMTVSKTACNLSDLISEAIAKYKSKSAVKALQFKISYQPVETNYDVFADEGKLKIILDNLWDNAIKYSPEKSGIDILIQKTADSFVITITNKIREDINPQVSDIKNEFYHSKPLHGEGFGLGLWIANQLAVIQDIEMYFAITQKEYFEAGLVINAGDFHNV